MWLDLEIEIFQFTNFDNALLQLQLLIQIGSIVNTNIGKWMEKNLSSYVNYI